jgi:hypothetical protein
MNELKPSSWGGVNLLPNGDFLDPINQRGKTSYAGTGYGIDGWVAKSGGVTVTPTAAGLKLTTTANSQIWSYVDNIHRLKGRPVTLSVKPAGMYPGMVTANVPSTLADGTAVLATAYLFSNFAMQICSHKSGTVEYLYAVLAQNFVGETTLEYAKLEEGSIATPLVRESRITRLAECRKYLFAQDNLILSSVYVQTNVITFVIPELFLMRVFPSISNLIEGSSGSGTYYLLSKSGVHSGFTLTVSGKAVRANKTNHGLDYAALSFRDSPPLFSSEI